jgi:hypothetical protein
VIPGKGSVVTAVVERPTGEGEAQGREPAPVNRMRAKALHTAVSDALNFAASPSLNVPAIATVRIEATDGQFVAIATDRYVLGVSRDYSGEAFSLTVDFDDAKNLVGMAKTLKRDESSRAVEIDVDENRVSFRFSTGEAITVRGVDVDFPRWRLLIPSTTERMGAAVVGVGLQAVRAPRVRTPDQPGIALRVVRPRQTVRAATQFTILPESLALDAVAVQRDLRVTITHGLQDVTNLVGLLPPTHQADTDQRVIAQIHPRLAVDIPAAQIILGSLSLQSRDERRLGMHGVILIPKTLHGNEVRHRTALVLHHRQTGPSQHLVFTSDPERPPTRAVRSRSRSASPPPTYSSGVVRQPPYRDSSENPPESSAHPVLALGSVLRRASPRCDTNSRTPT